MKNAGRSLLGLRLAGLLIIIVSAFALAMSPREIPGEELLQVAQRWMESAQCARSTGKILVLCRNETLVPIAAETPGDDPGHALVLGAYAATTGMVVTTSTIAALNAIINCAGIGALCSILIALRLRTGALFSLLSGPVIASQFNNFSPHSAQLGDACLAAILPIAILGMPLAQTRQSIRWICTGLVCLAFAATFRQSIGLMGLAASCIALLVSLYVERRLIFIHGAVLLLAILSYESPTFILWARDATYGLSSAGLMQRHGIWHNLYIGLGTDENPFGIRWDDSVGFAAASKAHPGVGWATQAYYDTIRGVYFKLLSEHPLDVLNIYIIKLGDVFLSQLPVPVARVTLGPTLLVIAALFAITGWQAGRQVNALQFVIGLFICFFIGQAVLFHYSMLYMHPIQIFMALAFGLCFDAEIARHRNKL